MRSYLKNIRAKFNHFFDLLFLLFWIASSKPDEIRPAAIAITLIPANAVIAVIILPKVLIGYVSPYPTVVIVIIDYHITLGIVPKASGCILPSAK